MNNLLYQTGIMMTLAGAFLMILGKNKKSSVKIQTPKRSSIIKGREWFVLMFFGFMNMAIATVVP